MKNRRVLIASSILLGALSVISGLLVVDPPVTLGIGISAAHIEDAGHSATKSGPTYLTPWHYVSPTGVDSGDCSATTAPCRTIQYAVDQSAPGDEVHVAAGVYTDVNQRGAQRQVLYLDKSVKVVGGFAAANWGSSDPAAHPTVLDAEGNGRVVTIVGEISPTLQGFSITGGDASGLGGIPQETDAGGGILVISATATIRTNHVFSNTSRVGGGLCLYGSSAVLVDNRVYSNTVVSDGAGGGAYVLSSEAELSDNVFAFNRAIRGGGLLLYDSDAQLSNNTIEHNTAIHAGGGLLAQTGAPTLLGNSIAFNTSGTMGGGLALFDSPAILANSEVFSNTAEELGGGLYLSASDATISNNIVSHNNAWDSGGGLRMLGSVPSLFSNLFLGNVAQEWGGGLYLTDSDAVLENTLVADNWAGVSGSGAYIGSSSPQWAHSTIVRNSGGDGTGLVITDQMQPSTGVVLTNSIISDHSVGALVTAGSGASFKGVLWHANVTDDVSGAGTVVREGEITGDPRFEADGYHISPGSAALDAGIASLTHSDIDGFHRPYNGVPDLGVDELIAASVHPDGESTLIFTDTRGIPVDITAPVGAVAQSALMVFYPEEAVAAPRGMSFAGHAFALEVYRNGDLLPGHTFLEPLLITAHYSDSDVVGLYEETLQLRYWDGGSWVDAAGTCSPPSAYARNVEQNWFALPVCHLSRFATFADEIMYDAFLPVMMVNPDLPERPEPPEPEPVGQRFVHWRAADNEFAAWELDGVRLNAQGELELDPGSAQSGSDPYGPGGYYGQDYYNGGTFIVGEALGPIVSTTVTLTQAIASWNAQTPAGTWVETQILVKLGGRWTDGYSVGIWAADGSTIERHSVYAPDDGDARVAVDTLIVTNDSEPLQAYRVKMSLYSESGAVLPTVRNVSLTVSETPAQPDTLVPGDPARWNRVLAVPECSQMVYPDGGPVWCSPTSTAMVLAYWAQDGGACEPRVRAAVAGVYDWLYDGHGNWPFNTAYAATQGLESYVVRLKSLAQAEEWIEAGVPVVMSLAWGPGELDGAPLDWSNGHLLVLVGFDASGRPVVNDPAAASNDTVQRVYKRAQLESLWLEHTQGTVYLIYPEGTAVPDL
jgi:hypothetical protein